MDAQNQLAAIVSELDSLTIEVYCATSATLLYLYEDVITFGDEVTLFWGKGWSGGTILFFMNRYFVLVYSIFSMTSFAFLDSTTCTAAGKVLLTMEILQYLPWAGFSAARAYAMSRNKVLTAFVFLLSAATIGINGAYYGLMGGVSLPTSQCTGKRSLGVQLVDVFTSASRASLIAADVLLIFITWSALSGRRGFRTKNSFSHVLLRDGTIYFICLLILNSVHLVFTELSIARSTFQVGSYVIYFTEPLTAILVSRFMMNLQVVNSTAVHVGLESRGSAEEQSGESSVGQVESVVFQHTIDSSRSSTIDSEDNRVYLAHATTPSA